MTCNAGPWNELNCYTQTNCAEVMPIKKLLEYQNDFASKTNQNNRNNNNHVDLENIEDDQTNDN